MTAEFTLVDRDGQPITTQAEGLLLWNGGTVCDDSFSEDSGNAICREMGFGPQISWNSQTTWTIQTNYEIELDDVTCDSSGEWERCSYVETHNCGHSEDVFLTCQGDVISFFLHFGRLLLIEKYTKYFRLRIKISMNM